MPKIKNAVQPFWQSENGKVVLYGGDCREVLPMLANGSIDFVFTDPPYGHNNNNGDLIHRREVVLGRGDHGEARPIANDRPEDVGPLVRFCFAEWGRLLKPGCCCCCCCGGGGPDPQFARWSLWLDELLGFKQMVVWDKGPMGMGWHYRRSYETVLVGEKPGAACRWFDETNAVENIIRPGQNGITKIIPSKGHHPTEKPVELVEYFIKLHTKEDDLVLDPFLGAGSTLAACARLNRRCIGIELDRGYLETAVKKYQKTISYRWYGSKFWRRTNAELNRKLKV
jgi:DNA modification methylase